MVKQTCNMRNFSFKKTYWGNSGTELDVLGKACIQDLPVLLVGTTKEIQEFRGEFSNELCWLPRADNYSTAINNELCVPGKARVICVSTASTDYERYRFYWESRGFRENYDFVQSDVFRPVYYLYKYNNVHLDRIEIFMTSHCSLNCDKCVAFIPYFKKKFHRSLDSLTNDLDILFSKVDFVRKLKLLGGEGLLYPKLAEYIEYIYNNYSDHIGTVRIGTNGTILPKQRILDVCRQYGVIIDVSDYSQAVPNLCHKDELLSLLEKSCVQYEIKRTGESWLDIGFPTTPQYTLFTEGSKAKEHFQKCAMFCRNFKDGKLWFCCFNFAAVNAGLFPENNNDFLDLRNNVSKHNIVEFELGLSILGHTTFCQVCAGGSMEANPNSIPVAIQRPRR